MNENYLYACLHHNVPRFIEHIKNRGGVSEEEWEWVRSPEDDISYPEGLLNRADEYLLYPNNKEKFEEGLFVLVKTLAIMSFIPNGIYFGHLHFDSDLEGFVELNGSS